MTDAGTKPPSSTERQAYDLLGNGFGPGFNGPLTLVVDLTGSTDKQAALTKLGLVSYGQRGDTFDPKIHEALSCTDSTYVTEDTCVAIMFPGYKVGDRILRTAKVAVAAPATGPDGASNEVEWPDAEEGN